MLMDEIYVVMVMEKIEKDECDCLNLGDERTVGWFKNHSDALVSVMGNSCDINEECYGYAIIEKVQEGLYHPAKSIDREWFEFSKETGKYIRINEPDICKVYVGFTIG